MLTLQLQNMIYGMELRWEKDCEEPWYFVLLIYVVKWHTSQVPGMLIFVNHRKIQTKLKTETITCRNKILFAQPIIINKNFGFMT